VKTQGAGAATSTYRTIASACILMVLVSLDHTILNVALPTIQNALTVPTGSLGWTVVAYSIPFATLMLSGGVLSDRYGPARVFMCGIAIFGIGSLIGAAALGFPILLLGRVVQGVGAALCMPSALAMLRASVPPQQLGRAIALWGFSASVAISAGPPLGGALVQFLTWRSIFVVNIPIVALAVWLVLPELRKSRQSSSIPNRTFDTLGQTLYIAASGLLIGGLILLRDRGDVAQSQVPVILLVLSAGGLVAFFLHERRTVNPVLPASLMENRAFQSAVIVGGSISLVNFGLVYCLGLYYGGDQGFTALRSGVLFLPMMVACGVAAVVVERARRAMGDRMTVTAGLAAQLAGAVLICVKPDHVGWVSVNAAFLGFGVGLALAPITAGLLGAVDAKVAGVASGALSSVRQLCSALGVAVLGLMVQGANTSVQVDLRPISAVCALALAVALATYLATSTRSPELGVHGSGLPYSPD
jgi:DHA2 family methylenomycin A resistance protein-like MFS transporter